MKTALIILAAPILFSFMALVAIFVGISISIYATYAVASEFRKGWGNA
jgi:hypothetical protein